VKLDDRGRPIEEEDDLELGDNCIIVTPTQPAAATAAPEATAKPGRRKAITVVEDSEQPPPVKTAGTARRGDRPKEKGKTRARRR
jgi:hypothetical protein